MACGSTFLRICLVTFNLVYLMFGLTALALGAMAMSNMYLEEFLKAVNEMYEIEDLKQYLKAGSQVLIAAGTLISVMSLIGCCGAWKQWKILLCCYAAFLFILLAIEGAALGLAYNFQAQFTDQLRMEMKNQIETNYRGYLASRFGDDSFTTAVDALQLKFQCCGFRDHRDYYNNTAWNRTVLFGEQIIVINSKIVKAALPWSCCRPTVETETAISNFVPLDVVKCQIHQDVRFTYLFRGCVRRLMPLVKEQATLLIAIAATIIAIEFFGMLATCCLLCTKRSEKKKDDA